MGTQLTRIHNWESAFGKLAEQKLREPFSWGVNDCVLMAMDFVQAITGIDLAIDYRGQYNTCTGAARQIIRFLREHNTQEHGSFYTFVSIQSDQHGITEIPVCKAGRADICFYNGSRATQGAALGICLGAQCLFAGGSLIPLTQCLRAWRI